VLKTDVLGTVKIGKDHREALLDAFERGGISGKAFARHHGVNYQTLASWIQKRRRENEPPSGSATPPRSSNLSAANF
jgi:transposase